MITLELYIGKSRYTIDCEESQRSKITHLASKINEKVNNLSLQMRGADEKTILMLLAIMGEEELSDLKNSNTNTQNHPPQITKPPQDNKIDLEKQLTQNLIDASKLVEDLANKIKNY